MKQLDVLEERRTELEQPGMAKVKMTDVYGRTHEQQAADTRHSIESIENKLRVLLSGAPEMEDLS